MAGPQKSFLTQPRASPYNLSIGSNLGFLIAWWHVAIGLLPSVVATATSSAPVSEVKDAFKVLALQVTKGHLL